MGVKTPHYGQQDIGKALALLDSGMSVAEISREMRINRATVDKWVRQRKSGELVTTAMFTDAYNLQKGAILSQMLDLQVKCLNHANKTLPKATAYQAVLMASILQDKMMGATGGVASGANNTVNIMLNNISEDESAKLIARVAERMQVK